MSSGFTTTILSASWKPRSGRDQVNKHQLDCTKKDQLERLWWSFSGIKMVFCSWSICHVEPRSMVLIMHQSLNGCVLSLWRNGAAKVAMECCFFMTTPPFTSATLFRLLFDRLASSNWIIQPILQIFALTNYHPLLNLKKFVRGKNFSSDDEAVTTVEDYLTDLNSEFFVKAYKVCMTSGSVWLLVKVNTFNKYDNCLPMV